MSSFCSTVYSFEHPSAGSERVRLPGSCAAGRLDQVALCHGSKGLAGHSDVGRREPWALVLVSPDPDLLEFCSECAESGRSAM